MNGGKLIQDVAGHAISYTHSILEYQTSRIYEITSTHHQMAYPYNLNESYYTILFGATNPLSHFYAGDSIDPDKVVCEPEIVVYHKKNNPICLGIQGHPEYMDKKSPIIPRINEIINDLIKKIK